MSSLLESWREETNYFATEMSLAIINLQDQKVSFGMFKLLQTRLRFSWAVTRLHLSQNFERKFLSYL